MVYASQAAYYVASISDTKVHALSLTCSLSSPVVMRPSMMGVHEYVGKRRERGKRSQGLINRRRIDIIGSDRVL